MFSHFLDKYTDCSIVIFGFIDDNELHFTIPRLNKTIKTLVHKNQTYLRYFYKRLKLQQKQEHSFTQLLSNWIDDKDDYYLDSIILRDIIIIEPVTLQLKLLQYMRKYNVKDSVFSRVFRTTESLCIARFLASFITEEMLERDVEYEYEANCTTLSNFDKEKLRLIMSEEDVNDLYYLVTNRCRKRR